MYNSSLIYMKIREVSRVRSIKVNQLTNLITSNNDYYMNRNLQREEI